jgi:PhzF family phenazine biosynthesis protein
VLRPFRQVDVFTSTPYSGNPVAVVLDGAGLDDAEMQRFARWTNLSETTFVLPPTTQSADYRLRIFTATRELPFAGHPTLGSCHAWLASAAGSPTAAAAIAAIAATATATATAAAAARIVVQECAAGLISIRRTPAGLAFVAPPLVRSGPVDPALLVHLAALLQIPPDDIVDAAWVDNGPGWVAVLLADAAAVLDVVPGPVDLPLGVVGPYPPGSACAFEVRAFFPGDGSTIEDPVTGSLNASLAQWLLGSGRAVAPYVASQGTTLGRAGRIHVSTDEAGIWVGGRTETCIVGEVDL